MSLKLLLAKAGNTNGTDRIELSSGEGRDTAGSNASQFSWDNAYLSLSGDIRHGSSDGGTESGGSQQLAELCQGVAQSSSREKLISSLGQGHASSSGVEQSGGDSCSNETGADASPPLPSLSPSVLA